MQLCTRKRERGAVLVVGLIMLLLLTIVGLSGIRNSTLQEKMAGAMIDRQVAFQAAEAALRAGKDFAAGAAALVVGSDGVVDDDPASGSVAFWEDFNWADQAYEIRGGDALEGVDSQPRYAIQELASGSVKPPTPGEEEDASKPVETTAVYRITARGTGRSGGSEVILQSIIEKL